MSISLTERAAKQVGKQIKNRGKGIGLRLGVKKSGCTGFAYVLDYVDDLGEGDQVFENFGVKLVVNGAHLQYLNGIEVDYAREGINEAFRFNNPNVKDSCGCGESFSI